MTFFGRKNILSGALPKLVLALAILFATARPASAACSTLGQGCGGATPDCCIGLICQGNVCASALGKVADPYIGGYGAGGLGAFLNNVVTAFLSVGGILLLLYLLFGGFKYITAGGDEKAIDSAKKVLTHAVIGIIIMATAFFIVLVMEAVLKVSIINTTFQGP